MAYAEYLAQEIAFDHADGLMSRREALRRLGLMGLGVGAAAALLAACGKPAPLPPTTVPAPVATPGASPTSGPPTTAATTVTTGPSGATKATAPPTDAAPVAATDIQFTGPNGSLIGHFAAATKPQGGVLVIHENRGLTDHFRQLTARLAGDGYSALALDLLSEEGGTATFTDPAQATAKLGAVAEDRFVSDMKAALTELATRTPGAKLGVMGFCFGGGQVWSLLAGAEPRLNAAVPFYGPFPDGADFSGSKGAAVLAIYAELDTRVNATQPQAVSALEAAGLTHEIKVFPGVDHAFFNDTGTRYNPAQAQAAYQSVLDWFGRHLAG